MSEERKKTKQDVVVVKELPAQPVNKMTGEDGIEYEIITVEEALKEVLKILRALDKRL